MLPVPDALLDRRRACPPARSASGAPRVMIEEVSVRLEEAMKSQQWDVVLAFLAEDVKITIVYPDYPDFPRQVLTKAQYAKRLEETKLTLKDISFRSLSEEFGLSPDGGTATGTSEYEQQGTLVETGETIKCRCKETWEIRLINGTPKATKIEAEAFCEE